MWKSIKKIQIKTTMKLSFPLVRPSIIKKTSQDVGKSILLHTIAGDGI
jgi:hypothetical protein